MTAIRFLTGFILLSAIPSFESDGECTKETAACPMPLSWVNKSRDLHCVRGTQYVCLQNKKKNLVEGCFANYRIPKRKKGCPYVITCDALTSLPVIPENDYHECPSSKKGCPDANHNGYSIYQIYKYEMCISKLRKDISQSKKAITTESDTIVGTGESETTTYFQIELSTEEKSTNTMPEDSKGQPIDFIISIVLPTAAVVIIMITVFCLSARYLKKRRERHKKGKTSQTQNSGGDEEETMGLVSIESGSPAEDNKDMISDKEKVEVEGKGNPLEKETEPYEGIDDSLPSSFSACSMSTCSSSDGGNSSKSGTESQWVVHCYGNNQNTQEEQCNLNVVKYCVTCTQYFCKQCANMHTKENQNHDFVPFVNHKLNCKHHEDCPILFFCIVCQEYICITCIQMHERDGGHNGHPTQRLSCRINDMIKALKPILGEIKSSIEVSKTELQGCERQVESFKENANIKITMRESKIEEYSNKRAQIQKKLHEQKIQKKDMKLCLNNGDITTLESYMEKIQSVNLENDD